MSSEQSFSTSDLRGAAQDYKRDAVHKQKWALGAVAGQGRTEEHPRPSRPSETHYNNRRRYEKGTVATLQTSGKAKLARKNDMISAGEDRSVTTSDDSSASADEDLDAAATAPVAEEVMYSFDASRGPSQGSQILNVALAKAIEKYEDKQTDKLVRTEYELVDSDGESLGLSPVKKGKARAEAFLDDEDYELV